jgi:threonine aldolase
MSAMIDLRSDTVTRPTAAMRRAMAEAVVGDDVYGEDPTVIALQAEVARVTGKEAALFVPSGSMGNQLGIACHTRRGDDVLVGADAHVVWYEAGAGAALSGVQFATCGKGGVFTTLDMDEAMKPPSYSSPRPSLVCVENTHNRAGGRIFPQEAAIAIAAHAHDLGMKVHLDGARIWNASVATGIAVDELCRPFDSVSVCFSKGLGAPVGSAICGTRALYDEARRLRKMWGGAMRQAGVLAAAALHALTHHRARLGEDHANARVFAEAAAGVKGARVDLSGVQTNMVNIDVDSPRSAPLVAKAARELGLAINPTSAQRLRAVTHLDVTRADVERAAEILAQAFARCA